MSRLLAALRIARRDALRAKGRSFLIAVMIGLPVFAMSFADVLARTAEPDVSEEVTRQLGSTQYVLRAEAPIGSGFSQAPDLTGSERRAESPKPPRYADLETVLPAGGRILRASSSQVEVRTKGGVTTVGWNEVAAADPAFAGRFALVSGRAPRSRREVLITPELLDRTGVAVGGRLVATAPAATVTVVGTARQAGTLGENAVYALPGTLIGAPKGILEAASTESLYVAGAPPLTWPQVLALNARGVSAYDRDIVLHPPPRSQVPFYANEGPASSDGFLTILLGAVLLGFAGLEVVLLAGAAFAVGARRQARSLALLVATGGSPRDVRRVVLAGGLVLGGAAAVAGVGAGILAAALARPLLESFTETPFARFDVRPLELLAIAAVGVITGVLAAVVPARAATRQDVVAALGGRRERARTSRRVPLLGVVLTLLGVASTTAGSLWTAAETTAGVEGGQSYLLAGLIAGGAGLALIGLVVLSPAIMGLAGRLARHLPLAPRLVMRDASRHRGRTAPAMAAVLAAVSGSVALILYVSAMDARDSREYAKSLPLGTAGVGLVGYSEDVRSDEEGDTVIRTAGPVVRAVEQTLPVRTSTVVRQVRDCFSESCRSAQLAPKQGGSCPASGSAASGERTQHEVRCPPREIAISYAPGALASGSFVVGDAALLKTLYGVDDPEAARTLARGGVVTFNPATVSKGRARFEVFAPGASEQDDPQPIATPSLRASSATPRFGDRRGAFLSPAAARRMGLEAPPSFTLFMLSRLPTEAEEDAANAALPAAGISSGVTVERGYVSQYGLGLLALILAAAVVTLGAAGIATGLAQADARADHATLAAVGAEPRLRRLLAALQALLIAGLGTALGVAVGFVPAVALIGAIDTLELTLPWSSLAGVLLGVPLLAAAAGWICTRSRLPLERRLRA